MRRRRCSRRERALRPHTCVFFFSYQTKASIVAHFDIANYDTRNTLKSARMLGLYVLHRRKGNKDVCTHRDSHPTSLCTFRSGSRRSAGARLRGSGLVRGEFLERFLTRKFLDLWQSLQPGTPSPANYCDFYSSIFLFFFLFRSSFRLIFHFVLI